jgi:hypothetical protein
MPLTKTAIRNAKPGDKTIKLYDERGLYMEVSPNGGKWWRLKYRYDGKEKRLSLGVYPDVCLKDARDRRETMHANYWPKKLTRAKTVKLKRLQKVEETVLKLLQENGLLNILQTGQPITAIELFAV